MQEASWDPLSGDPPPPGFDSPPPEPPKPKPKPKKKPREPTPPPREPTPPPREPTPPPREPTPKEEDKGIFLDEKEESEAEEEDDLPEEPAPRAPAEEAGLFVLTGGAEELEAEDELFGGRKKVERKDVDEILIDDVDDSLEDLKIDDAVPKRPPKPRKPKKEVVEKKQKKTTVVDLVDDGEDVLFAAKHDDDDEDLFAPVAKSSGDDAVSALAARMAKTKQAGQSKRGLFD